MPKISRKLLKQADETIRIAQKAYDYRSDTLTEQRRNALKAGIDTVHAIVRDKTGANDMLLQTAIDALETEMKASGGAYYPRNWMSENIEVLLVAAILAIGIRMFFIQPFRIPTNSMYPTYNGMTFEVFAKTAERPAFYMRPLRAAAFGASRIEVDAPVSGEIVIPVFPSDVAKYGFGVPGRAVKSRKWFGILPTINAQYTVLVGGKPVPVEVPLDFQFSNVVFQRFGVPTTSQLELASGGVWLFHTGVQVEKGQPFISFDILLGDQLFVDRMSYQFVRPTVGDPIVFRTDIIPGMPERERGKYYIKRLVGTPGDTLQVKYPVLWRNGAPITGAEAFDLNANKVGEYEGYLADITAHDLISLATPYTVPEKSYIGMGDNSDESADSRVWGPLPREAMVGRALVIYYPFTSHVGPAK
jgi:signal peptidase I